MSGSVAKPGGAARAVRVLAFVVIVVTGLKAAASLLVPIAVAAFVTLVALPLKLRLQGWGLPRGIAVAATLLAALLALAGFTALLTASLASFGQALPTIRDEFDAQWAAPAQWLEDHGLAASASGLARALDPEALLELAGRTAGELLAVLSSFVVILLLTIFALVEAEDAPAKWREALGDPEADLALYTGMVAGVGRYALWKTTLNALTGLLVAGVCWLTGVREPLLWGLLAFLFNFVPNVGALIVAVPIALLAWIENGAGRALLVVLVYLGVNQFVGSAIEPQVLGRRMGLSPLVVLLSLLVWGWLWGPVGMLLSVPLTMIVRAALLRTQDGRMLGVLLGPRPSRTAPAP